MRHHKKGRKLNRTASHRKALMSNLAIALVLNKTDTLMLAYYMHSEDVGIYSLSIKLGGCAFFVSSTLFAVFTPTIARFFGQGRRDKIKEYFINVTRWSFLITIPVYLILVIFAEEILRIFGNSFITGKLSLLILSTCFLINSVLGFSGQTLSILGRSRLILLNTLCAGSLNILLNIILIPKFGFNGAAVATGISIVMINIARLLEVYYLESFNSIQYRLIKPLLCGISTAMIIIFLKGQFQHDFIFPTYLFLIFLLVILYFGLIIIFGLEKDDSYLLQTIYHRALKHKL